jgi:hypothetical protein
MEDLYPDLNKTPPHNPYRGVRSRYTGSNTGTSDQHSQRATRLRQVPDDKALRQVPDDQALIRLIREELSRMSNAQTR